MKQNKKIYLFETFLFIMFLILKFVFIEKNINYKLVCFIVFPLLALLTYKIFGYQKERSTKKNLSILLTIICFISYIIIMFIFGLLFGFNESQFNVTMLGIIKNIYYLIPIIISEEIIRYIIIKKTGKLNDIPILIITFLFILFDIFLSFNFNKSVTAYEMFLIVTTSIIPSIVMNFTASYISKNISLIPGLLIRIFFYIYNFIFPIYPNIGYYLTSFFNTSVPFIIFLLNVKMLKLDYNKIVKKKQRLKDNVIYSILLIFVLMIVFLTSNIFKYQIIAIGSGSMSSYINYGDAIIFKRLEKEDELQKLKKGDVIVFNHDNKLIVHRIKDVYREPDTLNFITKGDNNNSVDNFILNKKDVVGKLSFRIRMIGYPTLLFNELLNKL